MTESGTTETRAGVRTKVTGDIGVTGAALKAETGCGSVVVAMIAEVETGAALTAGTFSGMAKETGTGAGI